ncbi:DNA polymerase/3'-5' exonuclease PolX [Balneolaceae bacterium ANBcel3]|nr:DNA polymerase/3'-5' exonuclease PolX [Balneolaceae bacterium ANBcel3]
MPRVVKEELAAILLEIGVLMRLAGENDFRAMAFDRAARTLESLEGDINVYIENKTLTDLKGIGTGIAADIYEFADTGHISVHDKLKKSIPEGLFKWLDISGLGPKKIFKIHKELGITEVSELKEKCMDGSVAALAGMGKKSAEKILKSIEWMDQYAERCRLDEAEAIARLFYDALKDQKGVKDMSVAGSLRRSNETIGDIDILIAAHEEDIPELMEVFIHHPGVVEVLAHGTSKSSVRADHGRQVDLRIVKPDQFAAALLYFTGSKEHNVALRQRARKKGLVLNEYGLFHQNDDEMPLEAATEEEIYHHLGLAFIPPELREDYGEFVQAEEGTVPDLVSESDIQGVIHAHSRWSDGKNSISELADACMERGYSYLCITDHSRSAAYAGGLRVEQVYDQWKEIDQLNDQYVKGDRPFFILKGIESDILADGQLDYPDEVLIGFDLVIGSVHSSLDQPPEKMLERLKRAIEHPYMHMLGHPTGRLLLKRDGNKVDLNELIRFASDHKTAIEINANPRRLDMDWRYGRIMRENGLMSGICPDAHSIRGLDDIRFGVGIARKAGLSSKMILNACSLDDLRKWLDR